MVDKVYCVKLFFFQDKKFLICLSNCNYLEVSVLPRIVEKFKKYGFEELSEIATVSYIANRFLLRYSFSYVSLHDFVSSSNVEGWAISPWFCIINLSLISLSCTINEDMSCMIIKFSLFHASGIRLAFHFAMSVLCKSLRLWCWNKLQCSVSVLRLTMPFPTNIMDGLMNS